MSMTMKRSLERAMAKKLRTRVVRDLTFDDSGGPVAESLGLSGAQVLRIDKVVQKLIKDGVTLRGIIEHVNRHMDLSDAEWFTFAYSLGFFVALQQRPVSDEQG
jgi:hypothetical protein